MDQLIYNQTTLDVIFLIYFLPPFCVNQFSAGGAKTTTFCRYFQYNVILKLIVIGPGFLDWDVAWRVQSGA